MAKASPKRGATRRSLQQATRVMGVLAHPMRIRLLERLERSARPLSVNDLAKHVRQPQHLVSQHLTRMHLHGLLSRRKRGREVFYRIRDPQIPELLHWIRRYQHDPSWVEEGEAI